MKMTTKVLLVASLLAGCSSTPEPTEAEATATATAAATADMESPPETTAAPAATETATATAAAPAPAPEPAADLAVVPMKIAIDPKTAIEIKADKALYTKGKKIATFDKNTMKLEELDQHMSVWKDGTIEIKPASQKKVKFNEKDEIEIEGGGKLAIDDKGKVTVVAPDNKPAPKGFAPVVTGFKPEARRAASLALLLALMTTTAEPAPAPPPTERAPSPKATGAAPTSTAPAPKK
ncbi:MAG: hypothetical protein HOW73_18655 [Polyangiaceae bacterium]|nr:hypothetical protein [Polyangiaceae bacterium]